MKAIVYHEYGSPDVLKLEEVQKPTPADNQLLIKVYTVSINRSDWESLTGKPLYARMMPNSRVRSTTLVPMLDIRPSAPTTAMITEIRISAKIKIYTCPRVASSSIVSEMAAFVRISFAANARSISGRCYTGIK
jgi:hypothetical protein